MKAIRIILGILIVALVLFAIYMMRYPIIRVLKWAGSPGIAPYSLVIVLILIVLLVIFIVILFRYAEKKEGDAEPADTESDAKKIEPEPEIGAKLTKLRLGNSFSIGLKTLKANVSGKDYRYQIPWVVMLGESECGKTTALERGGLSLPFGLPPQSETEEKPACNWWFFERGLVLDLAGDIILRSNGTGFSSDDHTWRQFLHRLQKHRPKQPLDGVVLSIPCTDLMISSVEPEAGLDKITKKADMLYRKLWSAQKILGIRFPLYILITKCDEIDGFKNFCQELPKHLTTNVLGWSNPYPIDIVYSSEWIREAFDEVERGLYETQFEIFTRGTKPINTDGIFLFPGSFRSLSNPLQVYLDRLFRQSIYHESFVLRGIYFCGNSGVQEGGVTPFFVKDLFDRKIFSELGIARPLKGAMVSRNRRVVAAQAATALVIIIGSLGLWQASSRLAEDKNSLLPVIEEIYTNIALLRERGTEKNLERSVTVLVQGMSNVSDLTYTFIPSSWFSDLHNKIRNVMILAYDEIIFAGMHSQMVEKAKSIFRSQRDELFKEKKDKTVNTGAILSVESIHELIVFHRFMVALKEFEKYEQIYNSLKQLTDLKALGDLIHYLYGIKLPNDFYRNSEYYKNALEQGTYQAVDFGSVIGSEAEWSDIEKMFDRVMQSNNIVNVYLDTLSLQLDSFGQKERNPANDDQLIRDLLETITRTETLIAKPELEWVFKKELDLGRLYGEILLMMEQSRFFGPNMRREFEKTAEAAFQKLKAQMKLKKSEMIGFLLENDGIDVINRLSSSLLKLKDDLQKLLKEEFMVMEPLQRQDIIIPPNMRIQWNTNLLQRAVNMFRPYEGFLKAGLEEFPRDLQKVIVHVAQSNLENKMLDFIARSQNFEPIAEDFFNQPDEQDIFLEIRNFKEAGKLLDRLMSYSDKLGLADGYQMLSELLYTQASRLLTTVESFLARENLYMIRGKDFSWWDGKGTLAVEAFNVTDEKELQYFLNLQRDRAKRLAYDYAEPVITFSAMEDIFKNRDERQMIYKWTRIISELEKYENKNPQNSVTDLERFVVFEMNSINKDNYIEKITLADLNERSGDIFLQKRNELRRMIYDRCRELAKIEAIREYGRIKDFFNQHLAGKFPFADKDTQKIYNEAVPEDIRSFFKLFDNQAPSVIKALQSSDMGFGLAGDQALDFLNQIESVRYLFAAYLDESAKKDSANKDQTTDKNQTADKTDKDQKEQTKIPVDVPAFDLSVKFRTNREYEQMANRIIEWNLTTGGSVVQNGDDEYTGHWRFGDPIRIVLRWAKNSPDYPVYGGEKGQIDVEKKTITYEFTNQWSIFSFLKTHAASPQDLGRVADPNPHTLTFAIETAQDGVKDAERWLTKAFITVRLKSPDKSGRELVIRGFPVQAPDLAISSVSVSDR